MFFFLPTTDIFPAKPYKLISQTGGGRGDGMGFRARGDELAELRYGTRRGAETKRRTSFEWGDTKYGGRVSRFKAKKCCNR